LWPQHLDDADVDLLLEQMSRKAVAQGVGGHALGDLGRLGSGVHDAVELPGGQRHHWILAREQPAVGQYLALGMADSPPRAQSLQQHRAEHGVSILAPLALLHAQGHALAVDVTDLQRDDLGSAQPRAVGHRQRGLVLEVVGAGDQSRGLVAAQHARQAPGHAQRLHLGHRLAAIECDFEEELQPRQCRVDRHRARADVDQVQLEAAQILGTGGIGRASQVAGELANGADVGVLGVVGQLAHAHVVEHALTQRKRPANPS
jgi:hypothetical protein